MEIKGLKRKHNNISNSVNTMVKKVEGFLDTPLTQFIEGASPIVMDYYAYDNLASVVGIGDKLTKGPYSGATKYKYIKDYIGYGYVEERNTTIDRNEKEDTKMTSDVLSFLHLPNTIIPVTGDRLTLKLENNQIFYYVTSVDQVTLHNKSFIKVDYVKDDSIPESPWTFEHMKKNKLISQELIFVQENLGTQYSPFMVESSYIKLTEFFDKRKEINDSYMSFFYDDYTNMLRSKGTDTDWDYSPLLTYLQMEYFPLKIYETNDLMLSNEALNDKMTIVKWQTHLFRKLINKKNPAAIDGITLYSYKYFTAQSDPYYKINTYMNSMDTYTILDITQNNDKKDYVVNPPEEIKTFLTEWYNGRITTIDIAMQLVEDIYLEEINIPYMIYTPLLLVIMDKVYNELYETSSANRFY